MCLCGLKNQKLFPNPLWNSLLPFIIVLKNSNPTIMKTWKAVIIVLLAVSTVVLLSFTNSKKASHRTTYKSIPKGCVFRTVMGEESSDTPEIYCFVKADASIASGLDWIVKAQGSSGGGGAGSHN